MSRRQQQRQRALYRRRDSMYKHDFEDAYPTALGGCTHTLAVSYALDDCPWAVSDCIVNMSITLCNVDLSDVLCTRAYKQDDSKAGIYNFTFRAPQDKLEEIQQTLAARYPPSGFTSARPSYPY